MGTRENKFYQDTSTIMPSYCVGESKVGMVNPHKGITYLNLFISGLLDEGRIPILVKEVVVKYFIYFGLSQGEIKLSTCS